jgi:7,8-dihydropterin-6-yl-methyl-4-(beta-D-ribofuranosyl)aminobenzene 5'-phosphate synthase
VRGVKAVDVVILSMLPTALGLGEWAWRLVETDGRRLFDSAFSARPETVLQNARELKIDLSGVTGVILSPHHGDHTGGS